MLTIKGHAGTCDYVAIVPCMRVRPLGLNVMARWNKVLSHHATIAVDPLG